MTMASLHLSPVVLKPGATRDPRLCTLYEVTAPQVHPGRRHCVRSVTGHQLSAEEQLLLLPGDARTFVYHAVTDVKKVAELRDFASKIKVSAPGIDGLEDIGFVGLRVGDAIFCRPPGGRENGEDDVLQVLVLSGDEVDEEMRQRLQDSRDELLGSRGERTPNLPTGGVGGTAFERTGYACSVDGTSRAYPLGLAIQAHKKVIAPTKSNKVPWGSVTSPGPSMRWHALEASIKASLAAARYLPPGFLSAMDEQANLVNAPRIGSDDNCLFSNVQVNIATPVAYESASCTLADQLGHFGDVHIDAGDLAEGYSCMSAYSDLPDNVDPGQFSIFELGVFLHLSGIKFIFFTGVMYHGGSPPRAKEAGVVIPEWAYRIVYIAYPQAAVYLALGVYMIGALRTQVLNAQEGDADPREEADGPLSSQAEAAKYYFSLGPDVFNNPECVRQRGWITHPNFVQDAFGIMLVGSLITFVVRSLYLFVIFILRQLPDCYEVKVDADTFFSSFSYKTGEKRAQPPSWTLAPALNDEKGGERRKAAARSWKSFAEPRTRIIPFSIMRTKTREDLLAKGKRTARIFGVHSGEHSEDVSITTRPESSYYQPVTFRALPAAGTASSRATGSRRISSRKSQGKGSAGLSDSPFISSSSSQPSRAVTKRLRDKSPMQPEPLQRTGLRSHASRVGTGGSGHVPQEELERPKKRVRGEDSEPSYAPGSQGGLGADKDTCSFSPQDVAEDDDQGLTVSGMKSEGQEQSDFQDWLQDEMTRHAPTEACRDIAIVVMGKISLSEGVQFPEEALVHPWYNPLNRSRLDGSCLADFASDCAQLPSTATATFSEDAFRADIQDAYVQHRQALEKPRVSASLDMGSSVRVALQALSALPGDASIDVLGDAWRSISALRGRISERGISRRNMFVAIMANDAVLWARVESLAAIYSQASLPESTQGTSLAQVGSILWTMVRNGECARTVDGSIFHPTARGRVVTLTLSYGTRQPQTAFERQRIVYSSMLVIIAELVGVTDAPIVRLRCWLVWAVVSVVGYDGLYHADVWHAWQRPHTRCLSPRASRMQPTLHLLLPFVLMVCAQRGPSLYPVGLLAKLAEASGDVEEFARASEPRAFFGTASKFYEAPVGRSHDITAPAGAHVMVQVLAVLSNLIGKPCDNHGRCLQLPMITSHGHIGEMADKRRDMLAKAGSHCDMFLPFRTFAPSSLRLIELFQRQPAGTMASTNGLRNVALARVITFGSPFLLSGNQSFCATFDDWLDGVERARGGFGPGLTDAGYFVCDRIYGRNTGRSLDIAESVWNACEWPADVGASRVFMDFWKALHSGIGPSRRYKIPHVGMSLALLIAGDYCMAGYLDEPSIDEIGVIIHKVNAGAIAGLVHMGFLSQPGPGGRHRLDIVQDAFARYYRWSCAVISPADRARWRWNVLTAECYLCKDSWLSAEVDSLRDSV